MVFSLVGCKASQDEATLVASADVPTTPQASSVVSSSDSIKDLPVPTSMEDRFSYTYGYMLFATMKQQGFDSMDSSYFAKGAWDAGNGNRYFTQEQMSQILHEVQTKMLEQAQAETDALAAKNLSEAESFLSVNKTRENVTTTTSGLQYQVLRDGSGETPSPEDIVDIDYKILLLDGTVVDSSYERGYSSSLQLKTMKVPGFVEGIELMTPGSSYRFWLPPDLGYGKDGTQSIGPNALLIAEVELKSVKKSTAKISASVAVSVSTGNAPAQ